MWHTLSVFSFFVGAPLDVLTSSTPGFLFAFEDDFGCDGVPRAALAGTVLEGLLSTGSSFGTSFCFGARTGDVPTSSSICINQKQAFKSNRITYIIRDSAKALTKGRHSASDPELFIVLSNPYYDFWRKSLYLYLKFVNINRSRLSSRLEAVQGSLHSLF